MNTKDHITQDEFLAFQCNTMTKYEKEKILEHISTCNYCADEFMNLMSVDIIAAPRDMKANLLKAVKRPEVQLAVKAKETTKRLQLFMYSLKVCTATVCALLLLFFTMSVPHLTGSIASVSTMNEGTRSSIATVIKDSVDKINNSLLDFSNTIINGGK